MKVHDAYPLPSVTLSVNQWDADPETGSAAYDIISAAPGCSCTP